MRKVALVVAVSTLAGQEGDYRVFYNDTVSAIKWLTE